MKSPFKFLDSYTKEDREIFFGRDREIEELYQRVFESKIMLVYGISGTGKSSLIHCGLANKFQETDWLPIVIRRGGNIIESMAAGIRLASKTAPQGKLVSPLDFKKGLRSLYLDHYKPVFFIFDQFEELFIFGGKEERRTFIQIVKSLIESDLQCRIIFIMREEYMAGVTEFEKFIPTFFSNRVRIEKMSHKNALEAIIKPCKVFNISLEEGFAETLLEKLSPGSEDVELAYLQVFLDKVFRMAQETDGVVNHQRLLSFTLSLLQKVGNVSDLLGSFLDDQISLMEDPDTTMTVLKAFVSGKGTKRPANDKEAMDNIHSLGKEITTEKLKELIQSFVKLRILRDKDENGRYELRHDALAEKVYEKFSSAEKELLEISQMIENAYQYYLKRKILLSNEDLIYLSNKDSLLNLKAELQGFLKESRKHQSIKQKTLKRLIAFSALAFIVLLITLAFFAATKLNEISSNYIAIKSITQIKDPVERLKTSINAWNKNADVLPKEALLKAFNNLINSNTNDSVIKSISVRYKLNFDASPVNLEYALCSETGKFICGYGDSLIIIWNSDGSIERTIQTDHFPILNLRFSDDDQYLAAVGSDSLLTVWDRYGENLFSVKIFYNKLNTNQIFKFLKGGRLICLSSEHDAVLFDPKGNILQSFDHHKSSVNAVDASSDNNFIATASSDSSINIWYFNSVKKEYNFYNSLTYHNDTVWSVKFSNSGYSVLSASSDSNIYVGTINNKVISRPYFPDNLKYCYAEFSKSNKGIIVTLYHPKMETDKVHLSINYNNPSINIRSTPSLNRFVFNEFTSLSFSPDEDYFTYSDRGISYLGDNRLTFEKSRSDINSNHILLEAEGTNPFFTTDNKYLIVCKQKIVQAFFINVEEIVKITESL
jgi:WD40 repeat protein